MNETPTLLDAVSLADRTTLGVGGPVRHLSRCRTAAEVRASLDWGARRGLPSVVLGGGSNLVVADRGFDGLAIDLVDRSVRVEQHTDHAIVRAAAGVVWDVLVADAVGRGLAGIEGLSGIPGRVGAAPIQNIGAYGQEVSETIVNVRAIDRSTGTVDDLTPADCGFAYRWSRFKGAWRDRYIIVRVDFRLERRRSGSAAHPELTRRLGLDGAAGEPPTLAAARAAVLDIRRSKSMVVDPEDPNSRSAGSFFTNPIVEPAKADEVAAIVRSRGGRQSMPRYPADEAGTRLKLSAAWLIEEAGFQRGWGIGAAGLSERHTLAIINRGGATAADIVTVASTVRRGVRDAFGITLEPEPVFLGFERSVDELLDDADYS